MKRKKTTDITSCPKASDGQRFPCHPLYYSFQNICIIVFFVVAMEQSPVGQDSFLSVLMYRYIMMGQLANQPASPKVRPASLKHQPDRPGGQQAMPQDQQAKPQGQPTRPQGKRARAEGQRARHWRRPGFKASQLQGLSVHRASQLGQRQGANGQIEQADKHEQMEQATRWSDEQVDTVSPAFH